MLDQSDLDLQADALLSAPRWYLGYSGGLDSTVLLHLLWRWCSVNKAPPLCAIHINHGLQGPADIWQQHCRQYCESLPVDCIVESVDVAAAGAGEQGARTARYAAFESQLEPGAVLFLAHHLDDQVETFFLRLLRGAGVEGLAAMPRQRRLGQGELVRPLLDMPRSELEAYAKQHALNWVEDPSNTDVAMDRNFLRREVLPTVAERWPAYRQSVARASELLSGAARVLDDVPATLQAVTGEPGVPVAALCECPAETAAHRLRAWLRLQGCLAPDYASLLEFLRQLADASDDSNPRLDTGSYCLQRYREGVYLLPRLESDLPARFLVLEPGSRMTLPGVGALGLRASEGSGLLLAAGEALEVRWRRGGERFRPSGRDGSHSLKALFQEWGVPPWWRARVPLFYLGHELVAVGGFAHCESSRWRGAAGPGEVLWEPVWEAPGPGSSH